MKRFEDAVAQFNDRYSSETACFELIERLRWPGGYHCPSCNNGHAYRIQTRRIPLFECRHCGHQTSLTAGTVMHRSKTSIRKWLMTMYLVATLPNSINAVNLSVVLGVTYKTAWRMLHVIRLAISATDGAERLSGHIEAKHELYLGDYWMIESRMTKEKSIIIARETGTKRVPRYKMKLITETRQARESLTEKHAYEFAEEYCSAELLSFAMNPRHQFSRRTSIFDQEKDNRRNKPIVIYTSPAMMMVQRHQQVNDVNGIESLSEAARRAYYWMNGTFSGISPKYAQHYFDEYCFRLNHADWASGELFEKLLTHGLHINEASLLGAGCIRSLPRSA